MMAFQTRRTTPTCWSIELWVNGQAQGLWDVPGEVERTQIIDLLRLAVAGQAIGDDVIDEADQERCSRAEMLSVLSMHSCHTLACRDGDVVAFAHQVPQTLQ